MNIQWKTRKGFTLLELLMVVIIIAILASIALPQYLRVAERSRASEALMVLASVRSSALRYQAFDATQQLPTDITLLDQDVPGVNGVTKSDNWEYVIAAGGVATATRVNAVGAYAGKVITIQFNDGDTCANDTVYGLPSACP